MRKSGKSDDFSISTSASSNVTGKVTGQQQTSTWSVTNFRTRLNGVQVTSINKTCL